MTVLEEAAEVINGKRRETHGDPREQFTDLAKMWSCLLGVTVTAEQVVLCMIALKLQRLSVAPHFRDSQIDVCGYARLLEMLSEKSTT